MAFSSSGAKASPSLVAPPLIPGLLSTHQRDASRTDFRRGQFLARMAVGKPISVDDTANGHCIALKDAVRAPEAVVRAVSTERDSQRAKCLSSAFRPDPTQPAWITFDRQVLRFFGYFIESGGDDNGDRFLANSRGLELANRGSSETVRRVVVCFHLSDRSIEISEPRVANSGRVQGAFLKRSVLSKPSPRSAELFSPSDFRVGGELRVCGRVIRLVDCDDATRTFYRETDGLEPATSPRKYPDEKRDVAGDEVAAIRDRLRAKDKAQSESAAERARKFHELSGKVLRFSAVWRDPHPLYPASHRLALLYYLSDDTLEVLELQSRPSVFGGVSSVLDSARTRSRVLLSRRRVALERPGHPPPESSTRSVTARDLRCGEWLRVFARDVFLEDCDPFTRDYYLEALGITQERFSVDDAPPSASHPAKQQQQESPVAAKWALFRSRPDQEADDRGYQLRHDAGSALNQRDALDGRQLRFRARFHGLRRDDPNAERQFVLTYFLEDDTLAVFEPRRANPSGGGSSGGGRFLDRGRFRKASRAELGGTTTREQQKERSAYRAEDFFVGAIICFEFSPNQRLELLEADAQTLAWCEAHPDEFPMSDANVVLDRLAEATERLPSGRDVVASLRRLDSDAARPGAIRVSDVLAVLSRMGLNAQQVLTLGRRFTVDSVSAATTVFPIAAKALTAGARPRSDNDGAGAKMMEEPRVCCSALCNAIAARIAKSHAAASGNKAPTAAKPPAQGLRGKLLRVPNLREVLGKPPGSGSSRGGDGWIPMAQFFEKTTAAQVELDARDVQELVALGCVRNGRIDAQKLWEYVETCEDGAVDRRNAGGLNTGRTHDDPLTEEGWWSSRDFAGDNCEPPAAESATWASPRRDTRSGVAPVARAPVPPLRMTAAESKDKAHAMTSARENRPAEQFSAVDASPRRTAQQTPLLSRAMSLSSVVALVQRVFGARKYQLRRALRERDRDKSGRLAEDDFMDAVLSVEPTLSDDDTYLIADTYFPTNNCTVDYAELLENAFQRG